MNKYYLLFLPIFIFLILSCSSDNKDDNPLDSQDEFPEYEINFIEKSCPEALTTLAEDGNIAASMAASVYETFDAINEFGNEITIAPSLLKINTNLLNIYSLSKQDAFFTKQFNAEGVLITLFQEITSDYVMGDVTLDGVHEPTNIKFEHWLQSEVFSMVNEFEGSFTAYYFNTENPTVSVEWNQSSPDVKTIEFDMNDMSGIFNFDITMSYFESSDIIVLQGKASNDSFSFDMKVNPDGSGEYTLWGPNSTILEERNF